MCNEDNQKKFGNKVKELRLENNLTQAQLAEKIGLSTNFIGMIERGERNTTTDKMFLLFSALCTSPKKFFETFE